MREKSIRNPWEHIVETVVQMLEGVTDLPRETVRSSIEVPPDQALGDLASTVSFMLAKELKKNPAKIAADLHTQLRSVVEREPLVRSVETKGPYLNVFLDRAELAARTLASVLSLGDSYGHSSEFSGKRALVEFPAVNPSKPWHIGHARNAILGDTLCNILECVGYDAVRLDYINDLGLQIAQLLWKIRQENGEKTDLKYDHYLGHLYVDAQKEFEENESVQQEVRAISRDLEDVKSDDAKLSAKMVTKCLRAQNQTAYRLGIYHDYQVWESAIAHSGILDSARQMMLKCENIMRLEEGEKAGCIVANLSVMEEFKDMKDPHKVLFRSDGTRTYTGADVALQLWKFGIIEDPFLYTVFEKQPNGREVFRTSIKGDRFSLGKFDMVMNVIASRQAHPQKLVYTILDLMGYSEQSENSHHIAYEFVGLEGADFSGRKGTWIGYTTDDVLDKATEIALSEVDKRNPDETEDFKTEVANQVAVGAVRYFMLNASPDREITFRWNEVLDFNGDAAPYLQYSHARAQRILEKAGGGHHGATDASILTGDVEFALVKAIARFPHEILEVVRGMKKNAWGTSFNSNRLTAYGYTLATLFSKFYDTCPVLKAEGDVREARLALVQAFRNTMANCLTLLGIPVVQRM
ncbi:MAG: arginine--tRNA ligase [Candidatus Thorarchaeota archaeon]|nr:MAG: arginine--tRNA ligase [Candidatus Thorarchaeota archaeon]